MEQLLTIPNPDNTLDVPIFDLWFTTAADLMDALATLEPGIYHGILTDEDGTEKDTIVVVAPSASA